MAILSSAAVDREENSYGNTPIIIDLGRLEVG